MGVDGRSGLLDSIPEGADEGAIGCQLVPVNLHDEPLGSVVFEEVLSASISSVLALTMNSFTAIFLDLLDNDERHGDLLRLGGLVLDDDDDAGLESQLSRCTPARRSS